MDIPVLILVLGSHGMILGCQWFDDDGIWPDVRGRQFVWPEEPQQTEEHLGKLPNACWQIR